MEFRMPQRGHDWIMGDPQSGQKFGTSWPISPLGNQLHSAFVHIAFAIDISFTFGQSTPGFPTRDPRQPARVQQNDQANEERL